MDLLDKHFPHEAHILVFDNTTTHTKCPKGALSACYMPKNTSKAEKNWGVEVNQCVQSPSSNSLNFILTISYYGFSNDF
jgi:hypothetical protein